MTVALSGDGADELFLGYNRYEYFSGLLWQQYLPVYIRNLFSYLSILFKGKSWSRYLRFLGSRNMKDLYLGVVTSFDTREFKTTPNYAGSDFDELQPIKSAGNWDKKHYLPNDINQKVDRASMFYGLEVRSPFLDKRITDFASTLPEKYMYLKGQKKHILRSLLYDLMPRDLFTNKKSGFTAPLDIWIESLFKDEIIEYINGTDLLELPFIDIKGMRIKCNEHFAGKRKHTNMLWRVLVYKRWRQAYV
jgi:asparagine synthase (glutamine-hydrolysing)